MAFAVFGPGSLYVCRTDIANATPINIGFVNEFSLDETRELKELYGQNAYPLAIGSGTIKATGKAKAAKLSGLAINAVFHGSAFTAGQLLMAQAEAGTIPGATTYTVTVANAAQFDADLGVLYAATGLPFTKVASAPTLGQYMVSAGVYTFAAADASAPVAITYSYTSTTGGQTKTVANPLIGSAPTFRIDYSTSLNGFPYYVRLLQVQSTKLTRQFKLTDFMMPEIDFSIFADAAGNVYKESYGDKA